MLPPSGIVPALPFVGDVYYSPRYNDDRYTYRHVLLTNGVRKEAERVAATVPGMPTPQQQLNMASPTARSCAWQFLWTLRSGKARGAFEGWRTTVGFMLNVYDCRRLAHRGSFCTLLRHRIVQRLVAFHAVQQTV